MPSALRSVLFFSLAWLALFARVLLEGRVLAPRDGLLYFYPVFYGAHDLWTPLLGCGYPALADPQMMTWYPPARLLAWLGSYNLFILFAFLVGCLSTGWLVAHYTGSQTAARSAGLIYAFGGFFVGHFALGHAGIIQAAGWVPLLFVAAEKLKCGRRRPLYLALGSTAFSMALLAGQPQVLLFALLPLGGLVLVLAPRDRLRYWLDVAAMGALGLGLAAVQWWPTQEMLGLSHRALVPAARQELQAEHLTWAENLRLVFPYLWGGGSFPPYGGRFFEDKCGFAGIFGLALAVLGTVLGRREPVARFWTVVAVLALLLTLGPLTPLCSLTYHLPVYRLLRAPSRHLLEFTLAVSVLAGLAVARLEALEPEARQRLVGRTLAGLLAVMAAGLSLVAAAGPAFLPAGVPPSWYWPWSNAALAIPCLLAGVGSVLLWAAAGMERRAFSAVLLGVLFLDLASAAWMGEWNVKCPLPQGFGGDSWARYRQLASRSGGRFLGYAGIFAGGGAEVRPDMNLLHGVPSAGLYSPMMDARYSLLLRMIPDLGAGSPELLDPRSRVLDVLAVRYLTAPFVGAHGQRESEGMSWSLAPLDLSLARPVRLGLPFPLGVRQVGLRVLPPGSGLRVELEGPSGSPDVRELRAGPDGLARLDLGESRDLIALVVSAGPGVRLVDGTLQDGNFRFPLEPFARRLGDRSFRVLEMRQRTLVYENLRALPRAWLAREAVPLSPDQLAEALSTGRLPDGRGLELPGMALVERAVSLESGGEPGQVEVTAGGEPGQVEFTAGGEAGQVEFTADEPARLELRTRAAGPRLLVLADSFYPGWQVRVDGRPVPLLRTFLVLRGVAVPAGEHRVEFRFAPPRLAQGALASGVSLVLLLVLVGAGRVGAGLPSDRRQG